MIKSSKNHLINAKENYLRHMLTALKISSQLFIASIKAFIHSMFPALFTKSVSSKIKELYLLIEAKNKK